MWRVEYITQHKPIMGAIAFPWFKSGEFAELEHALSAMRELTRDFACKPHLQIRLTRY